MEYHEVNLNDYVYVQLTDIGREALQKQHEELNRFAKGILGPYIPPTEDTEGWSKWQCHDLIAQLGSLCIMGPPPPFATTMRFERKP